MLDLRWACLHVGWHVPVVHISLSTSVTCSLLVPLTWVQTAVMGVESCHVERRAIILMNPLTTKRPFVGPPFILPNSLCFLSLCADWPIGGKVYRCGKWVQFHGHYFFLYIQMCSSSLMWGFPLQDCTIRGSFWVVSCHLAGHDT